MRVLFLTPEFDGSGGGVFTYMRALLPALRELGLEPVVFEGSASNNTEDGVPIVVEGILVHKLQTARYKEWRARFAGLAAAPLLRSHLAAAWALWEQAGRGADFDVIEASDYGLLFVPPVVEGRTPLLVQCHGSVGQLSMHDALPGEELDGAIIRMIERAALASDGCRLHTFSAMNAGFWEGETGRAVGHDAPGWAMPAAAAIASDMVSNRGLVVGRVQNWKGPHVLCGALRQLGSDAPSVDWVGRDMPSRMPGLSIASELRRSFPDVWGVRITHRPPVDPPSVVRLQAQALFNLVPSTWDVFNFTVVEGLASGRPTIVSSGAGASELIEDGRSGYLFESGDAASLADAIRRVVSETPERLRAVGSAGRELVTNRLDPLASARDRRELYTETIARHAINGTARPIDGWLADICRGRVPAGEEYGFLSRVPLSVLWRHVMARLRSRIS